MKEWITGRNPVYEMLRAKRRQIFRLLVAEGVKTDNRISEIMQIVRPYKIQVETVKRTQLDSMSDNHQGVAAEVSAYPYSDLDTILKLAKQKEEDPFILVLDTLQNPQNLGTLLRSAEAFGVHGVLIPLKHATGVTPAVVNASAGASEHMLIASANLAQSLEELKKEGLWVIGLEGSTEAQPPEKLSLGGPTALVVGGEGEGMRDLVRKSCDILMRLPLEGKIESLNAAVAGSIGLYLIHQARNRG
jgi:23S rRNA (guanosine2251-2'-O)-methyltransferase